ncbi:hypothetical protein CQA66_06940 [Helicobacter aurati]|uniref:Outer membrane beta-barrel protein n=1 Tax=Helicobacter aurati TaxID=137778 RepID=A0A3D8J212_9HELI|nr:hypothetical protein [Helicobacter aurati]RDU71270.1 hypothetical protein CQA66_06940 [Helicobacter aurati]
MLRKIVCFCFFLACSLSSKAQNYGGNYDWRMLGGGPLQIVSLHLGTSINTSTNKTGYSIGASIGWNYLSSFYNLFDKIEHIFDMGIRIKYDFTQDYLQRHSVGAELQFHFPYSTSNIFKNIPQPVSAIIGSGSIFICQDSLLHIIRGYYVEVGIGFAKFFPVNISFMYRWSFFTNPMQPVSTQHVPTQPAPIEKSIHIVFTLF